MTRILLIEDDPDMTLCLTDNLEQEGYEVVAARDGKKGLELALGGGHDLVLLDIMLPGLDGFSVCRELRRHSPAVPVIVISAKGEEMDKVLGLELGADDYVAKPFGIREILARVRAQLRRGQRPIAPPDEAQLGEVRIDFLRQQATRGRRTMRLSLYECEILAHLLARPGETVTRAELRREIWGIHAPPNDRTVDNYVVKLRRKIEKDPRNPRHLLTVHGSGYRFVP